jgi:hypothetical protein
LHKTQAERRCHETSEMQIARRLHLRHERENQAFEIPKPYNPAADGFVFSLEEIEAYVRREELENLACSAA